MSVNESLCLIMRVFEKSFTKSTTRASNHTYTTLLLQLLSELLSTNDKHESLTVAALEFHADGSAFLRVLLPLLVEKVLVVIALLLQPLVAASTATKVLTAQALPQRDGRQRSPSADGLVLGRWRLWHWLSRRFGTRAALKVRSHWNDLLAAGRCLLSNTQQL